MDASATTSILSSVKIPVKYIRRLAPLLPPQRPRTGRPARDHRIMVNAMLYLSKTGVPWRDLPERYGPWQTVATRFYRWTRSGLWQRILAELQRAADAEGRLDWSVHMIDATSIRAHRHAAGAKGGKKARRSAACGAGRQHLPAVGLHQPGRSLGV